MTDAEITTITAGIMVHDVERVNGARYNGDPHNSRVPNHKAGIRLQIFSPSYLMFSSNVLSLAAIE